MPSPDHDRKSEYHAPEKRRGHRLSTYMTPQADFTEKTPPAGLWFTSVTSLPDHLPEFCNNERPGGIDPPGHGA
jgi:hypothetical protein